MQKTVTAALVAALPSLTGAAQAGTGIDLQTYAPPIHAPKNPQANAMVNRWGESAERLAQSEINPPGQGD
ncbi:MULTISPECIES: hypothetical protein [Serratia]|uniref:hypothetical protein n=1 Tax=Serratia TaxID=613 RepID=UPI001EF8267E|nr:hypothetical protein [Serratia marcescens]MDX7488387.1 hypothetical protein [Serratia marcescens]BEL69463.1 hypothetical protein SM10VA4_04870 [Serratia marcescens]